MATAAPGAERASANKTEQRMEGASAAGLASRRVAARALRGVLAGHRLQQALDHALARESPRPEARERAFAYLITATSLRRRGQIDAVLAKLLEKPLPKDTGIARELLVTSAAQLLFLSAPAHAVVNSAVSIARAERAASRLAGLLNAVLRRVSERGAALLAGEDECIVNTPDWLHRRWRGNYGEDTARRIGCAHLAEPALDVSVKDDAQRWAEKLGGIVLPTGSIRLSRGHQPVEELPGYEEGGWWIQDAAAALPSRLLGEVAGRRVADLCAAPGGKSASLAARGAVVTAVEKDESRIGRIRQNLARLALRAEVVHADATSWGEPGSFDLVLLDAPCSSTGTIRRHPDIPYLKRASDIGALGRTQSALIDAAVRLLKPGGRLVYCTCSLEPEEGEHQMAAALRRLPGLLTDPVSPTELAGRKEWLTGEGYVRTMPFHYEDQPEGMQGLDGFFIGRLRKT
ncbi:MAG: methyltransferase [Hyphomicrobiaceae bacterium]|nr:MAG: methyltransferase [Hyphomicrobiaceae bacterium]